MAGDVIVPDALFPMACAEHLPHVKRISCCLGLNDQGKREDLFLGQGECCRNIADYFVLT